MLEKGVARGKGAVPFAALFVEKGIVVPYKEPVPYSESEQCGIMSDPCEINPLHMSPTKLGNIGDESC